MADIASLLPSCPPRLRPILIAYGEGQMPAGIAFMRLAMETRSAAEIETVLDRCLADLAIAGRDGRPAVARIGALRALAAARPGAWATIRTILDEVGQAPADPDGAISHWAAAFDRAVRTSPEASVALYSLGDGGRLAAATDDVVAWMRSKGLLGPERVILDIGCGIGRFAAALAGQVGHVIGIDISAGMVEAARRRCAHLRNVDIRHATGRDLHGIADGSIDCVIAVDSFPYVVQPDLGLAAAHFREVARVLRAGGDLLILNFSYRGDAAADREDVARLAAGAGFTIRLAEERPFREWDGVAFLLSQAP